MAYSIGSAGSCGAGIGRMSYSTGLSHFTAKSVVTECKYNILAWNQLLISKLLQKFYWLKYFEHALTHAYKEQWKWWSAIELARRYIFVLFVIPFPGNSVSYKHVHRGMHKAINMML